MRWDLYDELITALGSLDLLIRDDGETLDENKIKRISSSKLNALLGIGRTTIDGLKLIWNSATSISVGVGSCHAENGDHIDVTSALVKSGLSLSASTWYHIYIYLSSGVPAAEVVTTAPATWKATAYSKTGDTSRRYVGSILTDGSGNVYKFNHDVKMDTITYVKFALNAAPFRCLSTGTATTATAVGLSGIVPSTALLAYVRTLNNSDQTLYTSEDNGVGASQGTFVLTVGNVAAQQAWGFHAMDSSKRIWYVLSGAPGAGGVNLDVLGYTFER
jgi:hypothetical protein